MFYEFKYLFFRTVDTIIFPIELFLKFESYNIYNEFNISNVKSYESTKYNNKVSQNTPNFVK